MSIPRYPTDTGKSMARQETIVGFLRQWRRDHAYPPCLRDIGHALDGLTNSMVVYYLRILQKKGLVTFENGKARTIVLTEKAHD